MKTAACDILRFSSRGQPPRAASERGSGRIDDAIAAIAVLVIEDEMMIAWMLETLLEDMGFQTIMLAASGEEALSLAARDRPGLVISDINLGAGLDGVEAVATLHEAGSLPTLFVSGHVDDEARSRIILRMPCASVLRKPVQPEELRATILAALETPASH